MRGTGGTKGLPLGGKRRGGGSENFAFNGAPSDHVKRRRLGGGKGGRKAKSVTTRWGTDNSYFLNNLWAGMDKLESTRAKALKVLTQRKNLGGGMDRAAPKSISQTKGVAEQC